MKRKWRCQAAEMFSSTRENCQGHFHGSSFKILNWIYRTVKFTFFNPLSLPVFTVPPPMRGSALQPPLWSCCSTGVGGHVTLTHTRTRVYLTTPVRSSIQRTICLSLSLVTVQSRTQDTTWLNMWCFTSTSRLWRWWRPQVLLLHVVTNLDSLQTRDHSDARWHSSQTPNITMLHILVDSWLYFRFIRTATDMNLPFSTQQAPVKVRAGLFGFPPKDHKEAAQQQWKTHTLMCWSPSLVTDWWIVQPWPCIPLSMVSEPVLHSQQDTSRYV